MRFVATMRQIGGEHEGKAQKIKNRSAAEAEAASSQQRDAAEPVEEAQNMLSMDSQTRTWEAEESQWLKLCVKGNQFWVIRPQKRGFSPSSPGSSFRYSIILSIHVARHIDIDRAGFWENGRKEDGDAPRFSVGSWDVRENPAV
jgi:hypothetical protein